jgi:hypothetical protein
MTKLLPQVKYKPPKCLFHDVHTAASSEIMKSETKSAESALGKDGGKTLSAP